MDSLVQLGHRCSWSGCYRVQLLSGHLLSLLCGVQFAPLLVVHHLVVQLGPVPGLYILGHAGHGGQLGSHSGQLASLSVLLLHSSVQVGLGWWWLHCHRVQLVSGHIWVAVCPGYLWGSVS